MRKLIRAPMLRPSAMSASRLSADMVRAKAGERSESAQSATVARRHDVDPRGDPTLQVQLDPSLPERRRQRGRHLLNKAARSPSIHGTLPLQSGCGRKRRISRTNARHLQFPLSGGLYARLDHRRSAPCERLGFHGGSWEAVRLMKSRAGLARERVPIAMG